MATLESRIKLAIDQHPEELREAYEDKERLLLLSEQRIVSAQERRLKSLEALLSSEMVNMVARIPNPKTKTEERASWLRKQRDLVATYHDWEAKPKRRRTELRVDDYLKLCDDDQELFLAAYVRKLNEYFPITGRTYAWRVKLEVVNGHRTILHEYKRRRNAA
jgi:hypothetical protein